MTNYHPSLIVDVHRLLNNLIRSGVICEVINDKVRVQTGELITAPLPWFTARAGTAKTWWSPSVGEQVFILSPGGNLEMGCVLPAIYSNNNRPPSESSNCHAVFADGARFNYDPTSSTLTINKVKNVVVNSSQQVSITTSQASLTTEQADITAMQTTLSSPMVSVNSNNIDLTATKISLNAPLVECAGVLAFASLAGAGGGTPSTINGNIAINGELTNNGVSITTHTHNLPGYGATTPPK